MVDVGLLKESFPPLKPVVTLLKTCIKSEFPSLFSGLKFQTGGDAAGYVRRFTSRGTCAQNEVGCHNMEKTR